MSCSSRRVPELRSSRKAFGQLMIKLECLFARRGRDLADWEARESVRDYVLLAFYVIDLQVIGLKLKCPPYQFGFALRVVEYEFQRPVVGY